MGEAARVIEIDTSLEQEVRQEVAVYVEPIRSFLVTDDATMQKAGDTIKEINKRIKLVDEKFSDVMTATVEAKRKATAAKSALDTLIEEIKAPLEQVKTDLVRQGKDYQALVAKRQREEQARLAEIARKEEEDRLLAEAEQAEAAGDHEAAQGILDEPVYVPAPPPPKPAFTVDNRSFQKRWKGVCTNKMELIRFVSQNPQFQNLLDYNEVAGNNMARSIRGESPVKGVQFYNE
jgi:hypothetical protein